MPPPIHTIYFYYFKYVGGTPALQVYCKFSHTPIPDLDGEIRALAENALLNGDAPPMLGDTMRDIIRRRKGLIAIAVDGATFVSFEMKTMGNNPTGYTFGGQTPFELQLIDGQGQPVTITGAYFENWMQAEGGGNVGPYPGEEFRPTLRVHGFVPFYPDSGGTNMGPPIGPP